MHQILNELSKASDQEEKNKIALDGAKEWIYNLKRLSTLQKSKEDINYVNGHITILEKLLEMSENNGS